MLPEQTSGAGVKYELKDVLAAQVDQAVGWETSDIGTAAEQELAAVLRAGMRRVPSENPFPARTDDITVDDVRVRIYRPDGTNDAIEPLPVMLFLHGGGWVGGDLETNDDACRRLAVLTPCVVISVDYSLAPEARYPVALDEGWTVLRWILREVESWGGDSNRLAIGGSSAGGNLAASIVRRAREEGVRVLAQLLFYPVLDASGATSSYSDFAEGYVLTANQLRFFWRSYLGEQDVADRDDVSPGVSADLAGLPATYIVTAEYDPLRDEGEAYGAALNDAGISTVVRRFSGQIHGFVSFTALTSDAPLAVEEAATWLAGNFRLESKKA